MKKLFALLITLTVVVTAVFCMVLNASAESLYIRKVVSVVYDDSTSMDEEWPYANYAMQAFCGMLNEEDQLYITYMSSAESSSRYQPESVVLSASGIQESVDSIRKHQDSGSTPFEAVELAHKQLLNVQDTNPNTQYWLVVLTDGVFNEYQYTNLTIEDIEEDLTEKFNTLSDSVMANGTHPQITFLAIGENVVSPESNNDKGIYTYTAETALDIIDTMSSMADRISGRTRLDKKAVKQVDSKTVRVSSSMPLLNIAVFAQKSGAKIVSAKYEGENDIPIGREAYLSFGAFYPELQASAYLIGDSQRNIGAGTYEIKFDKDVKLDDIVVLFEPALEMRMTVTVNGKEIEDLDELDEVMEGDVIALSCKIYEMGTDNEISPSLMPSGTTFEIIVKENGETVQQVTGKEMVLEGHEVKHVLTEIIASVVIEGFNPIDYSKEFTPHEYVPVYTLAASYGGTGTKSIRISDLAANTDMTVCFAVFKDGIPINSKAELEALDATVTLDLDGNDGTVTYTDNSIVFTPKTAMIPGGVGEDGAYDVNVTCSIMTERGEVKTSALYTVLSADFAVNALGVTDSIVKTEFYGNKIGASFQITKDGTPLPKSKVENQISASVNEEYAAVMLDVSVADDGTITIVPYVETEHVITFCKWFCNWYYYFGLPDGDITVTLNHKYGSASTVIDVVEASLSYRLLNVWLPLITCIVLAILITAYIVRMITKPRFAKGGVLYVGDITKMSKGGHSLYIAEHEIAKYNSFLNPENDNRLHTFLCLINPFKDFSASVGGVEITAAKGDQLKCTNGFPWYVGSVKPAKSVKFKLSSTKEIADYCMEKDALPIDEIRPTCVSDEQNQFISQDDSLFYFVNADVSTPKAGSGQREVIESANAFCYSVKM